MRLNAFHSVAYGSVAEHEQAATLVLEPIFEANLPPEQYAYRPGRNAQQAPVAVHHCCC